MNSIDQIMQHDHERLDALLEACATAVQESRWQDAAGLLEQFRRGIVEGHMFVEETMLFPAFEALEGGDEHSLTALLRKGHQDLRVFFQEMAEAIEAQDAEEFNDFLSTVQTILKQHDAREEAELYPHLADALPDHGAAAAQRMADGPREEGHE